MTSDAVGAARRRHEDPRMLTGRSRYLADLAVDGASHVAVVRSPVAHGTLRAVTWTEEPPAGVELITVEAFDQFPGLVPIVWHLGDQTQASSQLVDRHLRYPGQPVALVVGPSAAAVADAVELVAVDVDELPVTVTIDDAVADDAPILHPDRGSNVLARFTVGDDAEVVDAELAAADHTLSATFRIGRLAGAPMEGRGVVAVPDGDRLVVHTSTQAPHAVRDSLASVLGWGLDRIRVVAPEVGGGFGVKDHAHDDELLVMAAAALLGRPLRWHESRAESLTVTTQARDEVHEVTVGFDDDGTLRALRIYGTRNTGAHLAIFGGGPLFACLGMAPGPYRWRAYRGTGTVVATNQVPTGAYRGFGQTQACLLRERIVDLVANRLGCDPVELRRRNLVRPDQQPWPLATGITYDNGDYRRTLDRAEELAARWPPPPDDGRRRGVGWCTYVQLAGVGPSAVNEVLGLTIGGYELATVTMAPDGSVRATVGVSSHGQGHETSFAQLVADRLGVDPGVVTLVQSDTDVTPYSAYGTAASRSMAVGGGAAVQAADRVAAQLRELAAHRLEANPADVELVGGAARVRGGGPELAVPDLAAMAWRGFGLAPGARPGLEGRAAYDPVSATFSFGTHVCRIAVDPATGAVEVERYAVVHDCGTIVNPMIVEGQIHGGVAQGVGAALLEEVVVDAAGQPLSGSFLGYLVPGSGLLPAIEVEHQETPSPYTPGGMKGMGEGATNGAFAAVVNAVAAALPEVTDRVVETPLGPERVWRLLKGDDSLP